MLSNHNFWIVLIHCKFVIWLNWYFRLFKFQNLIYLISKKFFFFIWNDKIFHDNIITIRICTMQYYKRYEKMINDNTESWYIQYMTWHINIFWC